MVVAGLTITANGNLVVSGAVGGSTALSSYAVTSTGSASQTFSANITTSGNQTYTAAGGIVTSGARTFTSNSGTVNFVSALSGDNNVTVTGAADIDGAITDIAVLAISGASNIGANITTSGTQTYTGAVTLSAAVTLTTSSDVITFEDTVNSANSTRRNLTLATGGNSTEINFDGIVGGSQAVGAIAITGALDLNAAITDATSLSVSGVSNLGADVTTTGTQTYSAATTLSGAARTLEGSTIQTTTINGAQNLAITGNLDLNGIIGGSSAIGVFSVSGTSNLGANVTTTGTQTYAGAVTLSANVALATSNDQFAFQSTVNSDGSTRNLTLNSGSATIAVSNAIGGGAALGTLTITQSGGTTFSGTVNADTVTLTDTTGSVTFAGNTTLATLNTASQNYNVIFTGAANTITNAVTFSNTGYIKFGDASGDSSTFNGGLTTTAPSGIRLAGTLQTSDDAMSLGDANTAIVLYANSVLNTGSAALTVNTTVNGGYTLTLNSSAATTFKGIIGGSTKPTGITTNSGGTVVFNTTAISTNGAQAYGENATISGNITFTTTNNDITFSGTVNSVSDTKTLTIVAGSGDTTFSGTVGGSEALGNTTIGTAGLTAGAIKVQGTLAITNSAASEIDGVISDGDSAGIITKAGAGNLTLSGDNTYTGATTVNAGTLIISHADSLGGTSGATTVASGGALSISGGLTIAEPITISGTGVSSGGAIVFTGGDNTYSGAITLGATSTIVSTGGAQTISGTVNAGNGLTITSNSDLTISGVVGGSTALSAYAVTTTGSGTQTFSANVTTTGNQTYTAAGGITSSGARTFTSNSGTVNFASALAGNNNNLTVSGAADIDGAVTNIAVLSITGASNISANITSSGTQTYGGAVTLSANTTLTTSSDIVTFSNTVNSADSTNRNLTVTTGGNSVHINFDGIVGGSQGLGAIALTGVLDLNAAIADANSLTVSGSTSLDADVTTSGTQTYTSVSFRNGC